MPSRSPVGFSPKTTKPNFQLIRDLSRRGYKHIVGIDEVGRGALAGPLIVVAVEINQPINGVADSKKLSILMRQKLAHSITRLADQITIGIATNQEIDDLGLATAQRLAYNRALAKIEADLVLTDNYRLSDRPHLKAIQGDSLFYPTAAASIIAKVYRDQLMRVYHHFHPHYDWQNNVGYGTAHHLTALGEYGYCPLHRLTFL